MTFLDAGAGTGKTTRLVHRVLTDVLSGNVRVTALAVITFTEKAAAELRDRIRIGLARAANGDPALRLDGLDPLPLGPVAQARAAEALAELHAATICTLHAFAKALLEEHAGPASGSRHLRVLDSIDEAEQFARRWPLVAEALLGDPMLSAALDRSVALGVELARWQQVAQELDGDWDRCEAWLAHATTPTPSQPLLGLADSIIALQQAELAARQVNATDKLAALIAERVPAMVQQLIEAEAAGDDFARVHALTGALLRVSRLGQQRAWGSAAAIDGVRALLDVPRRELGEIAVAAFDPILQHLAAACVAAARARLADGAVTYHDLLVAARDLLLHDDEARLSARHRYAHILIDEFQDTDPLQADLALALAWPPPAEGGGTDAIDTSRLTFVGDPKQSIYRFRRADIDVYTRMKARFTGRVEVLDANRRSRPEIVDWVNTVFARLFARAGQVTFQPLLAKRRPVALAGPGVATVGGPVSGSNEELRATEGAALAGALRTAIETWTISDPDTGTVRPARPSDIAVLLRTRALLPDLEQELSAAGVPYRVESKGYGWASQDVLDVVVVLAAIDDPADPSAVVAALRGRVLGCDDDALLAWHDAGRTWDLVQEAAAPTPESAVVADGLAWLASLHARRFQLQVHELVRTVIEERALQVAALDRPRPRDAWARLQMLVDAADAFVESDSTATLRRFLARCTHAQEQGAISNERVVTDPDDDAVRVLTIHSAKGLEFPIVFVAGLGLAGAHNRLSVRWDSTDDGVVEPLVRLEVRAGDQRTDVDLRMRTFEQRRLEESEAEAIELERLAYVACTRARDHLVVSLFHVPLKAETRDRRLSIDLHAAASGITHTLVPTPRSPGGPCMVGPGRPHGDERDDSRFADELADLRRAVVAATVEGTLRTRRASDHDERPVARVEPSLFDVVSDDDPTLPRRFGRAVHAVLEQVPFGADEADLDALCAAAALEHAIDDVDRVRRCGRSLCTSPAWREASAAGQRWRELSLDGTIDGVVYSGQADLVWERTDGSFGVADWKNDPSDDAALRARYEAQLHAYARLLRDATGRAVTTARIVAVHPFTAERREIETLPAGLPGRTG